MLVLSLFLSTLLSVSGYEGNVRLLQKRIGTGVEDIGVGKI